MEALGEKTVIFVWKPLSRAVEAQDFPSFQNPNRRQQTCFLEKQWKKNLIFIFTRTQGDTFGVVETMTLGKQNWKREALPTVDNFNTTNYHHCLTLNSMHRQYLRPARGLMCINTFTGFCFVFWDNIFLFSCYCRETGKWRWKPTCKCLHR